VGRRSPRRSPRAGSRRAVPRPEQLASPGPWRQFVVARKIQYRRDHADSLGQPPLSHQATSKEPHPRTVTRTAFSSATAFLGPRAPVSTGHTLLHRERLALGTRSFEKRARSGRSRRRRALGTPCSLGRTDLLTAGSDLPHERPAQGLRVDAGLRDTGADRS
jgi:hypothetical protein